MNHDGQFHFISMWQHHLYLLTTWFNQPRVESQAMGKVAGDRSLKTNLIALRRLSPDFINPLV